MKSKQRMMTTLTPRRHADIVDSLDLMRPSGPNYRRSTLSQRILKLAMRTTLALHDDKLIHKGPI